MIATPDKIDGPWFSAAELFERIETDQGGGFRQFTVRDRIPVTGRPAGFMRLRIQMR
jgi:hypothetical protein